MIAVGLKSAKVRSTPWSAPSRRTGADRPDARGAPSPPWSRTALEALYLLGRLLPDVADVAAGLADPTPTPRGWAPLRAPRRRRRDRARPPHRRRPPSPRDAPGRGSGRPGGRRARDPHQRLKVLEGKGVEATDVVVIDVEEAEEKALNLALNSPRISGEWTADALGLLEEVVGALPDLGDALLLSGLRGDLEKLFPQEAGDIVEDPVPEPPDDPVTKPGDLWVLGHHRLLCGDTRQRARTSTGCSPARPIHLREHRPALQREGRAALEQRDRAPGSRRSRRTRSATTRGSTSRGTPRRRSPRTGRCGRRTGRSRTTSSPTRSSSSCCAPGSATPRACCCPGARFYIWGGYANVANYPPALKEAGFYFSQAIIWDKQHPVLTRKDFMGAHEWCFYGVEGRRRARVLRAPNNAGPLGA